MTSFDKQFQRGIDKLKQKVTNEINWDEDNIKLWRETAEEKQAFYCATLGSKTWEEYTKGQELYLQLKIGFSLYGPPFSNDEETSEISDEKTLELFFEDANRKKVINRLTELISNEWQSEKLYIAFIYVIAWINEEYAEFPVIRLLKEQGEKSEDVVYFIDSLGRVYKNWTDFIQNNEYPKCIYCYPKDGYYSWADGKVFLEFGRSPRSKILKKLGKNLDAVSNVAGLGSAAVLIAGVMVPLAAPVVAGAAATGLTTSVWSTCRTLTEMADRKKHSQSLSLTDPEGRSCWISLAAGILGAASSGAIQYTQFLAKNGRIISRVVDLSSLGITGLGIINNIISYIHSNKFKNCSELVLSILFFCHCSISLRTAKEIILEIEKRITAAAEVQLSPEQQTVFANLLMESKKCGLLEGNESTVKSLKIINSKDTFFKEFINNGK